MAQTTIQGSFLGDGTVTGVKIGADFISAQTALGSGLATTDEIIVSDAGVIKRMDISVFEIAATQITASGTLPALNGSNLTALSAANITASGTLPALNGAALTALTAANITASGTLPALNGAALTALSAANITASGTLPALVGTALTALDASNLSTGTLPAARIGNDSIDSQHYAPTSIDNEHLADDAVGIAELSATGTASSSTFLRGDNAWVAPGGGPSQATQSAIEAETNEDTYAPPDLIKYSPGMAKVNVSIAADGSEEGNAYNVASITDTTLGDRTIVIDVDFGAVDYSIGNSNVSQTIAFIRHDSATIAVGSVRLEIINAANSARLDHKTGTAMFGKQ